MLKTKNIWFWSSFKNNILSLVFFLFIFSYLLFVHYHFGDNSDEGVVLAGAWNLFNGKELYTDFFEFIPPASFYLIKWTWAIFGLSFAAAKILSIMLIFVASIYTFKIASLFTKGYANYLPPFIFSLISTSWPIVNHNSFNIVFLIITVYYFLKYLTKPNIKNLVLTTILVFISSLFLLHKTFFLAILIMIFLLIQKKEIKLNHCSIYLSLLIILASPILYLFGPQVLLNNLIIFPFFNYHETNKLPMLAIYSILFYVFFFFYKIIKIKDIKIAFLFILQILLLITAFQRPDFFHLSLVVFPILVLMPYHLSSLNSKSFYQILNYIFIFSFLLIILFNSFFFYKVSHSNGNYSTINNYIHKNCQSKYLYFGPFLPGAYFHSKKINPTSFDWLITNQHTEEQFTKALEELKKNNPDCAIINYNNVKKFNYNIDNKVDNYFSNNYKVDKIINENTIIYKK